MDGPMESGSGAFNNTDASSNLSLTCAARNLGPVVLPYSAALTVTIRVIQIIYNLLLLVTGTFLYIVVVIFVAKYKKLQTLPFAVALQVVVLDLLLLVVIVGTILNMIANRWLFGEIMCGLEGFYISIMFSVRVFLMFVFVIDRFLAIFWTFGYPKHKVKVTVTLSIASWVLSLGHVIPYVLDCFAFKENAWSCGLANDCNDACSYFNSIYAFTILVPSMVIPTILYVILFIKGLCAKKAAASMEVAQHRKREWKAVITFSLLFVTLLAVTLPNLVAIVILDLLFDVDSLPPALHILAVAVISTLYLLIITDPIVIMRNRDFREILDQNKQIVAMKKWFSVCKKSTTTRNENENTATTSAATKN